MQKFYSISIGTTGFVINLILLSIGAYCFGLAPAMYTIVAYFGVAKMSNVVNDGFNHKKNVFIISNRNKEIAEAIINRLAAARLISMGKGLIPTKRGRSFSAL